MPAGHAREWRRARQGKPSAGFSRMRFAGRCRRECCQQCANIARVVSWLAFVDLAGVLW